MGPELPLSLISMLAATATAYWLLPLVGLRVTYWWALSGSAGGTAIMQAIDGHGVPSLVNGVISVVVLIWWWLSNRRRRRALRLAGAKTRAVLAKMAARLRDRARPAPVPA